MFSFFSFDSLVVILQLLFVCTCVCACARDRFAFEAPMVNLICKSDKRLSFKPRKMTARCADEKAPWGNWRLWRKTVWLSAEHSQVFLLHHFRHLLSFLWLCQLWKKKKCQKLKKYPPQKREVQFSQFYDAPLEAMMPWICHPQIQGWHNKLLDWQSQVYACFFSPS